MAFQLRQLLRDYTSRRSPWGPPWWIYGVTFGAANLVRQSVIILTAAEIPQAFRVASWVATALVVVVAVNTVAGVLRRGGDSNVTDITVGLTTRSVSAPSGEEIVVNRPPTEHATTSTTWAPWWAYVVFIVGANYLRRAVGVDVGGPAVRVVVALTFSVTLFVIITAVYRANTRRSR